MKENYLFAAVMSLRMLAKNFWNTSPMFLSNIVLKRYKSGSEVFVLSKQRP